MSDGKVFAMIVVGCVVVAVAASWLISHPCRTSDEGGMLMVPTPSGTVWVPQ